MFFSCVHVNRFLVISSLP